MPAPKGNTFALGNKGGGVTKYNPDILIRTNEYIKQAVDGWERYYVNNIKKKTFVNKFNVKLPSLAGLANYLDTTKKVLLEWGSKYEEFRNLLDKIQILQEERLLNKGISGEYNSNIAKLILTKHGYSDKQEVEHSGSISLKDILSGINDRKDK